MQQFRLGVVLCAAGRSLRMGGTDKIDYMLGGKPVHRWAAECLLAYPQTAELAIVVPAEKQAAFAAMYAGDARVKVCAGGATRQESVANGVRALGAVDLIAVHDGARPFLRPELIDAVCRAALEVGGAIPAMPVTDTIHVTRDGLAVATPERSALSAAQTPQIFRREIMLDVLRRVEEEHLAVTDDCSAAIACGYACRIIPGSADNLKITSPSDLAQAERIATAFLA